MTEKRFIIPDEMRVIKDTVTGKEAIFFDTEDGIQFLEWLNSLNDENEQLKERINFAVLCLITKIMIYKLTLEYNINNEHIDSFKEELDEIKRSD